MLFVILQSWYVYINYKVLNISGWRCETNYKQFYTRRTETYGNPAYY